MKDRVNDYILTILIKERKWGFLTICHVLMIWNGIEIKKNKVGIRSKN